MLRAVIAAACIFWRLQAHAEPVQTIVLPAGAAQTLSPDGDGLSAVFATQVNPALATLPELRPVAVVAKDGHAEQLLPKFRAEIKHVPGTSVALLTVLIAPGAVKDVPPGSYSLVLSAVLSGGAKSGTAPQSLNLTVTRVTPQIFVPFRVVTSEERLSPWDESPTVVTSSLELRESSQKSPIYRLGVADYHEPAATGPVDEGQLSFSSLPQSIAAGGTVRVVVGTNGKFPLGSTMGKIEISSPDLAAPVTTPFEVRVRLSRLWLIGFALLGLGSGWLVRVYLAKRQQLAAARVGAEDTLADFRTEFREASDKTYRLKINAAAEKIQIGLKKDDATAIADAVKSAREQVQQAASDVQSRLKPVVDALPEINGVLAAAWSLPHAVSALLATARQEGNLVQASIEENDAVAAVQGLGRLTTSGFAALAQSLNDFSVGLGRYLSTLSRASFTRGFLDSIAELHDLVAKAYPPGTVVAPLITNGVLRQLLVDVHRFYGAFSAIAEAAPNDARALIGAAEERASHPPEGDSQADDGFATATIGFATLLRTDVEQVQASSLLVPSRLDSVCDAWIDWLVGLSPHASVQAIRDQVLKGEWLGAVEVAVASNSEGFETKKAVRFELAEPDAEEIATDFELPDISSPALVTGIGVMPAPILSPSFGGLMDERLRLRRITDLQTVIVAVLFVGTAYVAGEAAWVGTPSQMLALFILAFGVDLSSDGVLSALKKSSTA